MQFPKPVMSISELEKMGFPKHSFKTWVNAEGFPGYKTQGGGKWLVDTEKLPAWIKEYNKRISKLRRR